LVIIAEMQPNAFDNLPLQARCLLRSLNLSSRNMKIYKPPAQSVASGNSQQQSSASTNAWTSPGLSHSHQLKVNL